jgi:RimJ/RimL family protein N-acetyltransferase
MSVTPSTLPATLPAPRATVAPFPPHRDPQPSRHGRPLLRRLQPSDRPLVETLLERLSERSRTLRFAAPMPRIPERVIRHLCAVDGSNHVAVGAFANGELVGMGRFVRLQPGSTTAEVALTVVDDWQGRGLGRELLDAVALAALEVGVEQLTFTVSGDNHPAQKLLGRAGVRLRFSAGLGEGTLAAADLVHGTNSPSTVVPFPASREATLALAG